MAGGIGIAALLIFFGSCHRAVVGDEGTSDTTTVLADLYKDMYTIGVAVSPRLLKDSLANEIIRKQFNSITAENEMKWESVHPEPGVYDFTAADEFVEFGEANNMEIIGHVLIWHSQTPRWVYEDEEGNELSREALLARMRDHIHTVVGRYKGRVDCWDVVNEAISDDGQFRQNRWCKIIGEDYVQKAFEYAHEADPQAKLIYNDFSLPTPMKRDKVVEEIGKILDNGVRVDAIGMQGHYHLDYPSLGALDSSITAFSSLGVKVMITEMDINILPFPERNAGADVRLRFEYDERLNPFPDSLPDSMQTVLATRYASLFEVFNRHSETIDRVTLWGVQDGSSWLNYWPIRGRSNYPLLFGRDYQPKKAFWAVADLVR